MAVLFGRIKDGNVALEHNDGIARKGPALRDSDQLREELLGQCRASCGRVAA